MRATPTPYPLRADELRLDEIGGAAWSGYGVSRTTTTTTRTRTRTRGAYFCLNAIWNFLFLNRRSLIGERGRFGCTVRRFAARNQLGAPLRVFGETPNTAGGTPALPITHSGSWAQGAIEIQGVFICLLMVGLWVSSFNVLCPSTQAGAVERTATESELKAVYILNFEVFVGWPTNKLAGPDTPFVIGVLGNNAVATELDHRARKKTRAGRRLIVRRLTATSDLTECHVIFVGRDQNMAPVLANLAAAGDKAKGILTVGEDGEFVRRGGMINLFLLEANVRYAINPGAAEKAGLKFTPQLLRSAQEIIPSPPAREKP